eukprot:TRINITY_DN13209_c0_g1_i1.p1 TRINITY_DN13209_c0_g1~~TRINITY_DN13209_c0_g1_i1.p1  ORF type:complete len:371 (+),score=73.72 TRINITY_DN13209_c0_g1_i1:58-1113(+)
MARVTIKTKFEDDLRRFSVQDDVSFAQFSDEIKAHYGVEGAVLIKYFDDEGDLITITNDLELQAAFSFIKTQVPPILRVSVYANVAVNLRISNQYPTIPVSQWDAPVKEKEVETKKIVAEAKSEPKIEKKSPEKKQEPKKPEPVKKSEPVNKSPRKGMSAQLVAEMDAFAQELSDISANAANDTLESSTQTLDGLRQDTTASFNSLACSELSAQIAKECIDLSKTTSQLCDKLAKVGVEESTTNSGVESEVEALSNDTVKICYRLSQQTSEMCAELSNATNVLTKQAEEQRKSSLFLQKQSQELMRLANSTTASASALSMKTSEESAQYSADTITSSAEASDSITNTIKEI